MNTAAAHLRRHREGVLLADETAHGVRFVLEGESGRVVFPADGTIMEAEELVLFVPRESPADDHELQLLLSAGRASEGAVDRWRAYHGAPRMNGFGAFTIEGAKFDGAVVEETLTMTNPLMRVEGRLCRMINSDRAALAGACARWAGVEVKEPLAVGVDAHGMDVKARFGIVRLEFPGPVSDESAAERAIAALLKGSA